MAYRFSTQAIEARLACPPGSRGNGNDNESARDCSGEKM
jgi:hypothetical protein